MHDPGLIVIAKIVKINILLLLTSYCPGFSRTTLIENQGVLESGEILA